MNSFKGLSLHSKDVVNNLRDFLRVATTLKNSNYDISIVDDLLDIAMEYTGAACLSNQCENDKDKDDSSITIPQQPINSLSSASFESIPAFLRTPMFYPVLETIGTRIHTIRTVTDMSPFLLAQAMGVPRSCVEAWEDGSTIPAGDKILPLASLLRCDPLWLLGDSDGTEPPALLNGEQSLTKTSQSTDGNLILGDRIQIARENLDITEAELARKLNTYSDHITDWECGITEPPASMVLPLASALKCDPLWLLTGNVKIAQES